MEDINNIGYQIILSALNNKNLNDGLLDALSYIKAYIHSSDIILYKFRNNNYHIVNAKGNTNPEYATIFLNKTKEIIEGNNCYQLYSDNMSNIMFIPIILDDAKYMIAIMNYKLDKGHEKFITIIRETMTVILNNLELYKKMQWASSKDSLTGVDNRHAYNEKINEIEVKSTNCVYAIFDLFRLKYINDNYSHLLGDNYIIKAAEILKKYFPKYIYIEEKNGNYKKISTGTCVYRIGGDEFVVITDSENKDTLETKIQQAAEEVKALDLKTDGLLLGLNYGIASKKIDESMESVYLRADNALRTNKTEMYKTLKLDRRK